MMSVLDFLVGTYGEDVARATARRGAGQAQAAQPQDADGDHGGAGDEDDGGAENRGAGRRAHTRSRYLAGHPNSAKKQRVKRASTGIDSP